MKFVFLSTILIVVGTTIYLLDCGFFGAANLRNSTNSKAHIENSTKLITRGSILVCISGQTRDLLKPGVVLTLESHIFRPLHLHHKLHTYFIVDNNPALAAARARLYGDVLVDVISINTTGKSQSDASRDARNLRSLKCRDYFHSLKLKEEVRWLLYTRPDILYFEDAPDMLNLKPGIHMRARIWDAPSSVDIQFASFMSWLWWEKKAGKPVVNRSIPCSEAIHSCLNNQCITFDDQLAIMDVCSAENYFNLTSEQRQRTEQCCECNISYIEGQMTRRLIGTNSTLHVLSWSFRLARFACMNDANLFFGVDNFQNLTIGLC